MNLHLKERWQIYWNGDGGVKHLIKEFTISWKYLPSVCVEFGAALVAMFICLVRVLGCLLLPLFFWIVPVLAIFTAHRTVSEEEIRARMRREMHINGVEE